LIEIEFPLTPTNLDKLLQISSFVDSKLPQPKGKPICPTNFMLLDVTPENNKYKDTGGKMRIIPTARQMTIWQFTINLVARANFEQRELVKFKNYPHPKSFRALKRLYLHRSYESLRKDYNEVLLDLCVIANKEGINKFLK
jgi:hypothetical protein